MYSKRKSTSYETAADDSQSRYNNNTVYFGCGFRARVLETSGRRGLKPILVLLANTNNSPAAIAQKKDITSCAVSSRYLTVFFIGWWQRFYQQIPAIFEIVWHLKLSRFLFDSM